MPCAHQGKMGRVSRHQGTRRTNQSSAPPRRFSDGSVGWPVMCGLQNHTNSTETSLSFKRLPLAVTPPPPPQLSSKLAGLLTDTRDSTREQECRRPRQCHSESMEDLVFNVTAEESTLQRNVVHTERGDITGENAGGFPLTRGQIPPVSSAGPTRNHESSAPGSRGDTADNTAHNTATRPTALSPPTPPPSPLLSV